MNFYSAIEKKCKIQNILNVSHKQALEMKRFLKLSDASADPYFFHSIILALIASKIQNSSDARLHVCIASCNRMLRLWSSLILWVNPILLLLGMQV